MIDKDKLIHLLDEELTDTESNLAEKPKIKRRKIRKEREKIMDKVLKAAGEIEQQAENANLDLDSSPFVVQTETSVLSPELPTRLLDNASAEEKVVYEEAMLRYNNALVIEEERLQNETFLEAYYSFKKLNSLFESGTIRFKVSLLQKLFTEKYEGENVNLHDIQLYLKEKARVYASLRDFEISLPPETLPLFQLLGLPKELEPYLAQ